MSIEQTMTTAELLDAFIWGVEPDNYEELETELRERGIEPKEVATRIKEFAEKVADTGIIEPVSMTSRYNATCFLSGQPIKKGEQVMYWRDGKRGQKVCKTEFWQALKAQIKSGVYGDKGSIKKTSFGSSDDDPAATLARMIEKHLTVKPGVDEAEVEKIVNRIMGDIKPTKLEIKLPDGKTVTSETDHKQFPTLLKLIACRMNTYMVGPAGSGKTSAAQRAAEACGLDFSAMSVGPQTSEYKIMGHIGPDGSYHSTLFRERYEKGGVFFFDELDSANAGVVTVINAATANTLCAFPDGMVSKNPDFVCIAAGNTYGTGANRIYVGRNPLDGSTIDRFKFLEWSYDETAELRWGSRLGWTRYVQSLRRAAEQEQIRHIISPRASIDGGKMLEAGFSINEVMEQAIWKGLAEESRRRILNHAGVYTNEV